MTSPREVTTIILALGSAGAFTAAIKIFNAFLKRGRKRKVKLRAVVDGKEKIIELETEGMSQDQTKELVGELWPTS